MGLTESDYYYEDDFFSPEKYATSGTDDATWYGHGDTGGSADIYSTTGVRGGAIRIRTGSVTGYLWEVDMGTRRPMKLSEGSFIIEARMKVADTATYEYGLEVADDVNNLMALVLVNSTGTGYWKAWTISGGVGTIDSGSYITPTTWAVLRIVATTSDVKFYLNNALISTESTDAYITDHELCPVLYVRTWANATRTCYVDMFKLRGKR